MSVFPTMMTPYSSTLPVSRLGDHVPSVSSREQDFWNRASMGIAADLSEDATVDELIRRFRTKSQRPPQDRHFWVECESDGEEKNDRIDPPRHGLSAVKKQGLQWCGDIPSR
jgi:hypothetical protein